VHDVRGSVVKVLVVGAAMAAVLIGGTGAARAVAVWADDPSDAPAGADITSVRFRNGELTTGTIVHVRGLQRSGRLALVIAKPHSQDARYEAQVWIDPDGTLVKRLVLVGEGSMTTVPCPGLTTSWTSGGSIPVTVPHSCLPELGFNTQEYYAVQFRAGGVTDTGPARVVGRGGSPGCVTRGELGAARLGMTRQQVHEHWDTPGRLRVRRLDYENRSYPLCGVPGGRVFAEFSRSTDGVYFLTRKTAVAR
jgi:hypothetical protein